MENRVFSPKKLKSVTKSIRMPESMVEILERVAKQNEFTLNAYIVLALDIYLQTLLANGELTIPHKNKDKK